MLSDQLNVTRSINNYMHVIFKVNQTKESHTSRTAGNFNFYGYTILSHWLWKLGTNKKNHSKYTTNKRTQNVTLFIDAANKPPLAE